MPFKIKRQGDKYLVISQDSGRVLGTHNTKTKAVAQLRALYANVPEASEDKKKGRKRRK